MTTKNQYIEQARAANPKPQYATINGVQVELTDDQHEAAIEAWAEMRIAQDATQATLATELATKKLAYEKLGLTDDEIAALVG